MHDVETTAGGLTRGERLLLRTVRLRAMQTDCHSFRPCFELACGCAGDEAYRMVGAFVEQLRVIGRRRIEVSVPNAARMTGDEASILEVFAFAQADDYRGLEARLGDLVAGEPPVSLAAAACVVGQLFALSGLVLRPPVRLAA